MSRFFSPNLSGLEKYPELHSVDTLDSYLAEIQGVADVLIRDFPDMAGPFRRMKMNAATKSDTVTIPKAKFESLLNKLRQQEDLTLKFREAGVKSELGDNTDASVAGNATGRLSASIQSSGLVARYIVAESTGPVTLTNVSLGGNLVAESIVLSGRTPRIIPIPGGNPVGNSASLDANFRGGGTENDLLDVSLKVGFGPVSGAV